jgi:RNA polymerase sigma factor (sigma-70 family)
MTADLAGLYAEHEPAARRLALALAPPAEADDLVAESFTRVAAAIGRGREPGAFKPYLMATVRHQASDLYRARHRLILVPDPEPPAAPGADELAAQRDEAGRARRAFASLDERWQAVLWATEVEGRRPAELATRFGLPPNGVAQLAVRAREGLRQAYLAQHTGRASEACRPFTDLLPAGTRGRLTSRQQARLDRHVAGCARCSALSGELTALNENLGALIGPGALTAGSLAAVRRLLPALLRQHMTAVLGSAVVTGAALTAMIPPALLQPVATRPAAARPADPAPTHDLARIIVRASDVPVRHYVPKHARRPGGGAGPGPAGTLFPGAGPVAPQDSAPGQGTAAAASDASPVTSAAGGAVSGQDRLQDAVSGVTWTVQDLGGDVAVTAGQAGRDLGGDVTAVTRQAGQLVSGAGAAVSGQPGQLVTQAGQDAGSDVTAVTSQAGQLVSGAAAAVSGTAGSLTGGL